MGEKNTPTPTHLLKKNADIKEKIELRDHIEPKSDCEPWNEYIVHDSPPQLLRVRTLLISVYGYPGHITRIGDPYIEVQHETVINVSDYDAESESVGILHRLAAS